MTIIYRNELIRRANSSLSVQSGQTHTHTFLVRTSWERELPKTCLQVSSLVTGSPIVLHFLWRINKSFVTEKKCPLDKNTDDISVTLEDRGRRTSALPSPVQQSGRARQRLPTFKYSRLSQSTIRFIFMNAGEWEEECCCCCCCCCCCWFCSGHRDTCRLFKALNTNCFVRFIRH